MGRNLLSFDQVIGANMNKSNKQKLNRSLATLAVNTPLFVVIAIFANALSLAIIALSFATSLLFTQFFGTKNLRTLYSLVATLLPHLVFWLGTSFYFNHSTGLIEAAMSGSGLSGIALYLVWPLVFGIIVVQLFVEYAAEKKGRW